MGMYTELYLSCKFKAELPDQVIAVLEYMFGEDRSRPETVPDHEFFQCSRWGCIGRCSSYYFTPFACSKLYYDAHITKQYYLTTRSDLKNYEGEIKKFLHWVMPYIDAYDGDHLGHYRYEEDDAPTLIYYEKEI